MNTTISPFLSPSELIGSPAKQVKKLTFLWTTFQLMCHEEEKVNVVQKKSHAGLLQNINPMPILSQFLLNIYTYITNGY